MAEDAAERRGRLMDSESTMRYGRARVLVDSECLSKNARGLPSQEGAYKYSFCSTTSMPRVLVRKTDSSTNATADARTTGAYRCETRPKLHICGHCGA